MLARDLVGWDVDRDATTSCCWPTTAATSCSPSTRCSTRMDAAAGRLVGPAGDLRRLHPRASTSGSAGRSRLEDRRRGTVMRQLDLWRILRLRSTSGRTSWPTARRVIADPEFRRRLDTVAGAVRQDRDHPEVRDRHLALPHPRPATTWTRSSTASCPSTRSTATSAFDLLRDGLPAPQAAVPATRTPSTRPTSRSGRSACWPRPRVPTSTRWSATCCASRRRGTCAAASAIRTLPNGRSRCPSRCGPDEFDDEERVDAPVRPLVGLRGRPRHAIGSRATRARSSRRSRHDPRSARCADRGARLATPAAPT